MSHWLMLGLVPLVAYGAVRFADSRRTHLRREIVEQSRAEALTGVLSGEFMLERLVVLEPAVLDADRGALIGVTHGVTRAAQQFAAADGASGDALSNVIPRVIADYQSASAYMVRLLNQRRFSAAHAFYAHRLSPMGQGLAAQVKRSGVQHRNDVHTATAAAALGDELSFGIAGAIILVLFARFVLVHRRWERRLLEHDLGLAHERYSQVVDTALEGVWTLDADARTAFVNSAMAEMIDLPAQEIVGQPVYAFLDADQAKLFENDLALLRSGVSTKSERQLVRPDGTELWVAMSASPVFGEDANYAGALAMVSDISAHKRLESELRHQADHDPLTGAYNRRRLILELEHELSDSARFERPGAVVILDVDQFKLVNDSGGHAVGDSVLRNVADVLRFRARKTDGVARLGGDEFALVLPGATEQDVLALTSDVRSRLCERQIGPPIMASFGIALFPADRVVSADELLVCADTALYEAKERGGDQACVYRGQASGALTWVQRIRTALSEERFVLYHQPIVDLETGFVTHHELLIRMLSQDGDLIPPGDFLPAAERFGLIRHIDRWVVEEGLRLARINREPVAINLSAYSIGDPQILDTVHAAAAAGLNPRLVMFEITETAAVSNMQAARLFADRLDDAGCKLALDDFGTGFGSFTYLKYLPARYLKIDMEFVREVTKSEADRQVIKSIVGIAAALGKHTIAEGVEDIQTAALLKRMGVDFAQGFHFGKPSRFSPVTTYERQAASRRVAEPVGGRLVLTRALA